MLEEIKQIKQVLADARGRAATQVNMELKYCIAHNTLFLSVEADCMEFVFNTVKEQDFGKVLINPTPEIYHQYWSDNMIVVNKLITEIVEMMGL